MVNPDGEQKQSIIYLWNALDLSMCEGLTSRKYPLRNLPSDEDEMPEDEEKLVEAFTRLSAQIISEQIEEEHDAYTIEDIKVRYK